MSEMLPQTPSEALDLLLAGNQRFVRGVREHPHQDADYRASLRPAQHPFAVLFGCSDSRLAAEIIFDRGLGDLFVVRTAGHVIGPEVLGSIEYGVEVLGAPLVAVLGHDSCGAVGAAQAAMGGGQLPTGFVRDVVERVMFSVLAAPDGLNDQDSAVEQHTRNTVDMLIERSSTIAKKVDAGECAVVGLYYRLDEGGTRVIASRGLTPEMS